jgi:hypothetical protein
MKAKSASRSLIEAAESLVHLAREEAARGYFTNDDTRVRSAAEKAWLAANLAVDQAMELHGRVPKPGPGQHHDHHVFLEAIGRRDLSKDLSYFADRLHADCFYGGACPTRDGMSLDLDEVAKFIRRVCETSQSPRGSGRVHENSAFPLPVSPSKGALARAKEIPAGPSDS